MEDELFGSGLSSISDDENIDSKQNNFEPENINYSHVLQNAAEFENEIRDEVVDDMPFLDVDLGKQIYLAKLPNFMSVEPSAFDPKLYEAEGFQDEFLDDEGRVRLKLKLENTIRSRFVLNEKGEYVRESNSRVIEWSDGSMTLHVGSEIFDILKTPMPKLQTQLFLKQGQLLVCKGLINEKLSFKPHSTASATHKRVTLGVADRISRSHKVRVIPAAPLDPEKEKMERIRIEDIRKKTQMKAQKRIVTIREKQANADIESLFDEEYDDIGNKMDEYDKSEDDDIFSDSSFSLDEEISEPAAKKSTEEQDSFGSD